MLNDYSAALAVVQCLCSLNDFISLYDYHKLTADHTTEFKEVFFIALNHRITFNSHNWYMHILSITQAWILEWISCIPFFLAHWRRITVMVNKNKAAEAAVLHHDLCTLCSSTSAEQTWHTSISELFLFSSLDLYYPLLLILTYWCHSDVYMGLNNVSALQAWEGAGICPRVLLNVWLVKQKRSVSQKKQVLVQFSLTFPKVKGVSGFCVISQDNCGLNGRSEGPGEGEILGTVRGDAWDGQCMTFFLCYTLWNISHLHCLALVCQESDTKLQCNWNTPWFFPEAVHTWVLSAAIKEQK